MNQDSDSLVNLDSRKYSYFQGPSNQSNTQYRSDFNSYIRSDRYRDKFKDSNYTETNPYLSCDHNIGINIYKNTQQLESSLKSLSTPSTLNKLIEEREIDVEDPINRFATVLSSFLYWIRAPGPLSFIEQFPFILMTQLTVVVLSLLVIALYYPLKNLLPIYSHIYNFLKQDGAHNTKNDNSAKKLLAAVLTIFAITAILGAAFALVYFTSPLIAVGSIWGTLLIASLGLSLIKGQYVGILRCFNEFSSCLSFSTIDKNNPPYPSKYALEERKSSYESHQKNEDTKTIIMEMGVPVHFDFGTFEYKIEPLFKDAIDSMTTEGKNWLYINYLEKKWQESPMTDVLKNLENSQDFSSQNEATKYTNNLYLIQMPCMVGLKKLIRSYRPEGQKIKNPEEKLISVDFLIDKIISNEFYFISDKVWSQLIPKEDHTVNNKTKYLNTVINTVLESGKDSMLSDYDISRINAHLTEDIRKKVKADKMNFTCKDGIDRGHTGKLKYLLEHQLLSKSLTVKSGEEQPKNAQDFTPEAMDLQFIQTIKSDANNRAMQVKLREGNHHIKEDLGRFIQKVRRNTDLNNSFIRQSQQAIEPISRIEHIPSPVHVKVKTYIKELNDSIYTKERQTVISQSKIDSQTTEVSVSYEEHEITKITFSKVRQELIFDFYISEIPQDKKRELLNDILNLNVESKKDYEFVIDAVISSTESYTELLLVLASLEHHQYQIKIDSIKVENDLEQYIEDSVSNFKNKYSPQASL